MLPTAPSRRPSPTAAACVLAAFLLAPALAVRAAPAPQGEPPAERPGFEGEVEVSEVLLDVVVTDGEGHVVLGLGPEDFVVEEEGEPVPVRSVGFYSNRRLLRPLDGEGGRRWATEAPEVPGADLTEDRYFVLLFDRPPTALADDYEKSILLRMPRAGAESVEWAIEELLPDDWVAVVSYGSSLALHHDFTRDRDRMARAIERAARGRPPAERWPSRTEPATPGISLASLLERDLARETAGPYEAIEVLAEALGTVTGRKNLILFGADLPRPGSSETRDGYRPMVEALNRANVAVYGIGLTGHGRDPAVERLARDTGGSYAFRVRDFSQPLTDIAQESSGYYLLSFESRHPAGESGYREVRVRTKNPQLEAKSRGGYGYGG